MAKAAPVRWISTSNGALWKDKRVSVAGRGLRDLSLSGSRHQTWRGMGGCFNELGWVALSRLSAADRARTLKALFAPAGCRFDFCRLPIGASDYAAEWYSYDEVDGDFEMRRFSIDRDRRYLLPYVKAAQALRPDLRFFASPWSPPTWLKYPKAMNNGAPIMDASHLRALALYYVKYLDAYAREGVPVEEIHVLNEPASRHHKFPMCEWNGAGLRDFLGRYLGPMFRKRGVKASIWLSTLNTSDYNDYVLTPLADKRARSVISGVGLQWEGRFMVRRVRDAWPDLPVLATENECGDGKNTWDYAQYVFDMMYEYITGGCVGYTYWNMVLDKGGASTFGWEQNSMVTVDPATGRATLQPEYYLMKHISHFVRPGAVRLGLAGTLAANAIAFENPNRKTVLVVNNPFAEEWKVAVDGRQGAFTAALPARSFNTFVL